jgi:hypothetical protein
MNVALWIVQGLLAALFLFVGVMKLVMPIEAMTAEIKLPGLFLRFIGVVETLGALGLILPGVFGTLTGLTPLAAAGLTIIMIGATVLSITMMGLLWALPPLVVGILCVFVAYGRWRVLPHRASSRAVLPATK